MIYCGYQGVGKTSYCKSHPDCIDLDSSIFVKDDGWEKDYVKHAIMLSDDGNKNVFISAHKEVIKELQKINRDFVLIIPDEPASVWKLRLKLRYKLTKELYALKALSDFKKNFKKDMKFYREIHCRKILVKAIRVLTSLEEELENEGI